ncbi:MAG: bifunctional (p)ppGpp synthetase/guanosine-3',5'-bis(diphosphate) 3'-pyrophosphohydrolase [Bacteroidota bacterium]|nr:bifunctional (p)ppGpp synthetase/guanosine-3',5'-bis(diphosphate) 3'-pyrophosphohydrolase [Bacteroidota bacterium]
MQQIDLEAERKEILIKYRELLRVCRPNMDTQDKKLIRKAFNLALDAHKNTRRKSGEPYIYHPLAVAHIVVSEIGLGVTSVVCSLLHDVVEDTDYTLEDIRKLFGDKIASIIDGLTKISDIVDQNASIQAENFKKMLLTLSDDVRVILIKLADRLHNMRTLDSMPHEKQIRIASETLYLYAPLAHRLGLYSIKTELDDLGFKFTEPEIYEMISQKIKETQKERTKFIGKFAMPIRKSLDEQNIKYTISGRVKSIHSIWTKMKKKDIPFEEVFDLFAIRIVIDAPLDIEKAECWKVYSIVTDFYRPNPDRLRDWISTPKSNGYESLHTTVMSNQGKWVEVQIRSTRMDEIAEKGYAAHWKYKEAATSESGLDEWLRKIREILQNPDSNALDFLDDFKLNLFSDEIILFTPKGDLKTLPIGATALDFAYNIHSAIGNSCIGAKVNHKLVPLNTELKSGDQIEIITSNKQKPKDEWLEYVVTARAKTKIKQSLKDIRKSITEEGREQLKEKFSQIKIEFNQNNINRLIHYCGVSSVAELFYEYAKGTINEKHLKGFLREKENTNWLNYLTRALFLKNKKDETKTEVPDEKITLSGKLLEKLKNKSDALVIGENIDKLKYTLSECCTPIPGDDIFGFITIDEGIKIHRINCEEGKQLLSKYGSRVVKAKWTSKESIAFLAGINVNGVDDVGIINNITRIISNELNVNIRSISFDTNEGLFEGKIMLYVHDTAHLLDLINNIKKVHGVIKVTRLERT